jgi:argininosuccinate lyase/amino-acid N-acetyltransferase
VHLSRLSEDLIFYSSQEAGYVELDDSMTSGSSMMPQKKNPDALELVRGKSGRLLGNLVSLCVTLKGLPLSYNKDLQEDKQPLLDSMQTLERCLSVLPPLLDGLRVRRERAAAGAAAGYANATDLADYLVGKGVPFRTAHEQVGGIVRHAIERGLELGALGLEELRRFAPEVDEDVRGRLGLAEGLARRDVTGGTAPARVSTALRRARQRLEESRMRFGETRGEIREARIDDLDDICRLVDYWALHGENLPRPREQIIEAIADFGVAVVDGRVVGCGSLSVYTPILAEIRSLGVDPGQHGGGFGSRLVRYFIDAAVDLHIPRVFVLTRAPRFFEKLGFRVESMDLLPEKVFKDCSKCSRRDRCDEIPMVFDTAAA